MTANELMIGDWLLFYDEDESQNIPVKIVGIDDDGWVFYEFPDGTREEGWCKKLYFIPITPEILEKNGWEDWHEHSKIARSISVLIGENTSLCIQDVDGQDAMFVQIHHCGAGTFEFRKHIKYVHELQHAFRLCGIDKEIVL